MRALSLSVLFLALTACGGSTKAATSAPSSVTTQGETGRAGKITTFSVDDDNLMVDLTGSRDGATHPDGSKDLVFNADLEGSFDALFVYATDDKGAPTGLLRANTLVGDEASPPELGGVLETGRLSVGITVAENGKFLNLPNGSLPKLTGEPRRVKLYLANSGVLVPGVHVRIYGRLSDGTLVKGPVIRY